MRQIVVFESEKLQLILWYGLELAALEPQNADKACSEAFSVLQKFRTEGFASNSVEDIWT
jgi:hypothetical protein